MAERYLEQVRDRRWRERGGDPGEAAELAQGCRLSPIVARVLANRGIVGIPQASFFLSSTLGDIHDPFQLLGMERTVDRLAAVVRGGEPICIYGDYDVDGITSVAMLLSFFRAIGANAEYYIPNRLEEGYGISAEGVRTIAARGTKIIVTVDCGITAVAEARLAAELGIDLIVTDHHMPGETIPDAFSVINPLQPGCQFPSKQLAGVGVAFNLLIALRGKLRESGWFTERGEPNLREYLDLVALGTIADIVPLTGENRIFVRFGLAELGRGERLGIRALKEVAGVAGEVSCGAVGFRLAPRLNAAGRLDDAACGVELLLTKDPDRAGELARELDAGNAARQEIEQAILHDAVLMVKGDPRFRGRRSIVLASDKWHPGVIGIVASRIVDIYHRPTILIAMQEGNGRGSGRSIPNFHLHDALKACSDHLLKFGGHKQAAGLSVDEAMLEEFIARFEEVTAGVLEPEDLTPELLHDGEISPHDITLELTEALATLNPFGMGNPEPVFILRNAEILEQRILKEKHLKIRVGAAGRQFDAIGFGMADKKIMSKRVDIAFSPDINNWNGRQRLQLRLKDIKEAGIRD